jgi:chromosome segregation ATPase
MRQRCPRQPRMGETCPARLVDVNNVIHSDEACKTCQDIATKNRRLQTCRNNLGRWRAEGNRFQASIEKVSDEARKLEELIQELESKRTSVKFRMSNTWQDPNGRATAHPPSRSR